MSRLVLLLLPFLLTSAVTSQEKKPPEKKDAPKVLYAVPLVAKPGEKQKIALRGRNLAAVKEVKVAGVADAKVKVLGARAVGVPTNYPAERVGDSEVEVELELPKGGSEKGRDRARRGADGEVKDPITIEISRGERSRNACERPLWEEVPRAISEAEFRAARRGHYEVLLTVAIEISDDDRRRGTGRNRSPDGERAGHVDVTDQNRHIRAVGHSEVLAAIAVLSVVQFAFDGLSWSV
jgi:hypothetical protein